MQQQVEGVEVLAHLVGQCIQEDAPAFQFFDQRGLALGAVPGLQEAVQRVIGLAQVDAGVVAQALGDQLAVGVEVLHALARHGHVDAAAHDVLAGRAGAIVAADEGTEGWARLWIAR